MRAHRGQRLAHQGTEPGSKSRPLTHQGWNSTEDAKRHAGPTGLPMVLRGRAACHLRAESLTQPLPLPLRAVGLSLQDTQAQVFGGREDTAVPPDRLGGEWACQLREPPATVTRFREDGNVPGLSEIHRSVTDVKARAAAGCAKGGGMRRTHPPAPHSFRPLCPTALQPHLSRRRASVIHFRVCPFLFSTYFIPQNHAGPGKVMSPCISTPTGMVALLISAYIQEDSQEGRRLGRPIRGTAALRTPRALGGGLLEQKQGCPLLKRRQAVS